MKYCDTCRSSYPADFATCPRDQSVLRALTELVPGVVLRGKYEILAKIGSGGMGAVYKARHTAFGELRAIKFVNTQLVADQEYLARFRSEAVVARKLQHPNAVRVEDLDATEDGRPFIVMEYVEGKSLRGILREQGAMPVERAVEIARQACAALDAAHAIGIIHRDIKPDNIVLLEKDGRDVVKVLDFGLAKILEGFEGGGGQVSTLTGMVVGTPQYMSPEQGMGSKTEPPDGRADLYALGVVLYELLTGKLPFYSDSPVGLILKHVQVQPIPPHEMAPERGIPEDLSAILMKTLAKDREDRYSTAGHMAAALLAYNQPTRLGQAPSDPDFIPTVPVARKGAPPKTLPGATAYTAIPGPRTTTRPRPPAASRPAPATVTVEETEASGGRGFLPWLAGAAVLASVFWILARRDGPSSTATSPEPSALPAEVVAAAPAGNVRTDDVILADVQGLLFRSSGLQGAQITAEVTNGIVTLSGEAANPAAVNLAVALSRSVPGVRSVFAHSVRAGGAEAAQAAAPAPEPAVRTAEATPPPTAPAALTPPPEDERIRPLIDRAHREIEDDDPEAAEATIEEVLRIDPEHRLARSIMTKLKARPPHPGGRRPLRRN